MFCKASSKLGCRRADKSDNVLDGGETRKLAIMFLETRPPGKSPASPDTSEGMILSLSIKPDRYKQPDRQRPSHSHSHLSCRCTDVIPSTLTGMQPPPPWRPLLLQTRPRHGASVQRTRSELPFCVLAHVPFTRIHAKLSHGTGVDRAPLYGAQFTLLDCSY